MSYELALLIQLLLLPLVYTACPTVSDQYDLSILNRELRTVYNTTRFYFNLCGNSETCYGKSGCYEPGDGGNDVSLGTVLSAQEQSDFVNITLSGDGVTTHITLLCGNSVGRPEIQHMIPGHVTVILSSLAGCKTTGQHPDIIPCYSYTATNELYDMGDLVGNNYHIPIAGGKTSIYFSMCGPVTGQSSCEGGAACYKTQSGTTNIGNVGVSPRASPEDGGVVITYTTSQEGGGACPETSTTIVLVCSPHQQSPPTLLYTNSSCTYSIVWRTEHACPVTQLHDVGCKIQGRGVNYDLTPLTNRDFTVLVDEHNYVVSVCGVISTGCNGEAASGCVSNTDNLKAWSMGSYHEGNLMLDDMGLTLMYTGGSQCSKGPVRSTKIVFVCDKSVEGLGAPEMTEQFYCFYSFVWRTKYACPVTQSNACAKYGTDGELYDLSAISHDVWRPITSTGDQLLFSVCGGLDRCQGASLCRETSDSNEMLASSSEHFQVNEDKSLVLTYEGIGECESSPVSLTVELTCLQSSDPTSPILVSDEKCNYVLVWQTFAACPAHSITGSDCKLEDEITGLTFDVYNLASQPWTVNDISIQLCGSLEDKSCGEGVSVCRSDGTALGYSEEGNSSSSKLIYGDTTLAMSMTGAECKASLHYTTLIAFMCEPDPAKKKIATFNTPGSCSYVIKWFDPSVCPMYPIQCSVSNDTHSIDLTSLYDLGNLEWSGQIRSSQEDSVTQTAVYIRACGQVTAGTEMCDHTAGVCAVQEVDGEKVYKNLGRAGSSLSLEGDVVREIYTNGDRVCSDKTKQAKTVVEFTCDKTQTTVLQVIFSDEDCMYVIEVATPHVCVEDTITATNCSITDPLTGLTYDFSHLTDDVTFSNANSHFLLHMCGPLQTKCGESDRSGACEVVNGNYVSLGDSSTTSLTLDSNTFTLTYTGGEECASGASHRETQVTLLCERATPLGIPRYINKDSESCVYHFEWEMAAACPPHELECTAIDSSLREYDLGVLRRSTPWTVNEGNYLYHFNVCGDSASVCGAQSSICRTDNRNPEAPAVSLGRLTGEPEALDDGRIKLVYHHGAECPGVDRHNWITKFLFSCETGVESMPEVSVNEDDCEVTITWRTLHACPAVYTTGDNCTVTNPVTGVTYDLWRLADSHFVEPVDEHDYTYSFCKPSSCNGRDTAGVCQKQRNTLEEKTIGEVNRTVTLSNGVVILHYNNGDVCSSGRAREMSLNIVCDHGLGDTELQVGKVIETSRCVYETLAYSGLPCDKEVLYACQVEGYDISSLSLTRGNYRTDHDQSTFIINVCRGINPPSPCPATTAICLKEGVKQGISIGDVSSASLIYEASSLKLLYTGADLCPETGNPYRSVITFICDELFPQGTPQYLSNSSCTFHFVWNTAAACVDREVDVECKILGYTGDTLLDLTPLRGVYTTQRADSESEYRVGVCQTLDSSQCTKQNTAVCLSTQEEGGYHVSLGVGHTSLHRNGEGDVVTATYANGDTCTRQDGTTTSYQTVLEFTCSEDSLMTSGLEFVAEDDCVVTLRLKTKLVCKEDRIACEVEKDGRTIDLSALGSVQKMLVSEDIEVPGSIYLAACHSLPEEAVTSSCPAKSAACLVQSQSESLSLGSITSPLRLSRDGNVELLYTRGSTCPETGSTYSTRIIFVCDPSGPGGPTLVDVSGCEYSVEWATDLTCETKPPIPVSGCQVTDPQTGYVYDLTKLTLEDEFYQTPGASYIANVCGVAGSCGNGDVAVCYHDNGKAISLGRASTVRTELAQERGEVEILYTGGDVTDKCPKGKSSSILIMCCYGEDNDMTLISGDEDSCEFMFLICSMSVCQFSPKECDFKIGGMVYDISPLARRHDNWEINAGDRTFYINPCRGVHLDATLKGCSEGSIACMQEPGVLGSQSIGLVSSRVPSVGQDTDQVLVYYDGGSEEICPRENARTEIMFTCANTLGKPVFLDDSSCRFKFAWDSFVACNSSARPITTNSCAYLDPVTQNSVDLSKTSHLEATSDMYKAHLAPCDKKLGKDMENGQCKGSSVCVKDLRNGRIVKFSADTKELFAREGAAELIIQSNTPCEDSEKKMWNAIVEYSCGLVESASFRAMAHCHVILDVETPVLCPGSQVKNASFLLMIIIVICGIALSCILIYICVNPDRRHKTLRKLRSIIPVPGSRTRNGPMAYKRLRMESSDSINGLLDSDEEIVGL